MTNFIPFPSGINDPNDPSKNLQSDFFFVGQNIRVDVLGTVGGVTNSPLSKSATATITAASISTSIDTVTVSGPTTPDYDTEVVYTATNTGDASNLSYSWTVTSASGTHDTVAGLHPPSELHVQFTTGDTDYTVTCEITSTDPNVDDSPQSGSLSVTSGAEPVATGDWSGTAPGYDSSSRPTPAPTWGLIDDTGFTTSSGQALKDTYLVDEFYLTSNNRPILIFRDTPGGLNGVTKRSAFQSLIPDTSTFTFEYDGNTASTEKNVGGSWGNQSLTDGAATRMPVTNATALNGLISWLQDGANVGKTVTLTVTPA